MTSHEKPLHTNRLANEQSPYLLQHAHNPVDWHPWGEEAFELARSQNKPVFLSIGYSTCHWCHVMERESFEDEEAAKALNQAFVCIKVDREERPDIDHLYMTACQAITGAGGWPLTAILTPDKKPFFVGTYYPKRGRLGRPGLMEIVESVSRAWKEGAANLAASAEEITRAISTLSDSASSGRRVSENTLETCYQQLSRAYDPQHGGFSFRPKFPTPHNMLFLLRYYRRSKDEHALEMVEKTLHEMRKGGIFDHIGYGFHRYSTDERWLVPHFEKMLYDQAMLVLACIETYQVTRNPFYSTVAREILGYVLRDMTSPEGGFYSAEDADSEGVEGKFYVWSEQRVIDVLGDEAPVFFKVFNFGPEGNFAEESTGELLGVNIPHMTRSMAEVARELELDESVLAEHVETMRRKMFEARERRVHPLKDDKILTDWNGLMIAAIARAARVLDNPAFLKAAQNAANFVLSKLRDSNGRLLKRYRGGQAALTGMLEDYAFFTWGLLELYEADFDPRMLAKARQLTDLMIKHFRDAENCGFFLSPDDGEPLPVRAKEAYDGATPSGNSVAALNLLRLSRITGNTDYEQVAEQIFSVFASEASSRPVGYTFMMMALDFAAGPGSEIVISGDKRSDLTRKMLRLVQSRFLPNSVLLLRDEEAAQELINIVPAVEPQTPVSGSATAYVCRNFACAQPTTEPEVLERVLEYLE